MSAISAARAARFIFRPSAASAVGVCGRTDFAQRPNAALAAAAYRYMSKAVPTRPAFLVDTLAIVRGMEARGIESEHAEAITAAITKVMNDLLESVGKSFVSQDQMQKSENTWDADFSKFKSKVEISQDQMQKSENTWDADFSKFKSKVEISQEQHSFSLQRSSNKLEANIDQLYWRIRDELIKQISEFKDQNTKQISEFKDQNTKQISEFKDENTKLISKLDSDIHAMRAQLEVAKNDFIKYCIGALISISTVTVVVLRSWV